VNDGDREEVDFWKGFAMKAKTTVAAIMICALALFATLERGRAAPGTTNPSAKVGIVSIRDVFKKSAKHTQYTTQLAARMNRAQAQLDQLAKEVETEEGDLKTLKPGTTDYMQQLDSMLAKRFEVQRRQEYLKQQRVLESKKWLEDIYQETLEAVNDIAREKGLDLVLEKTDPEFPVSNEELFSTLSTHKVLFSGGCIDLTDEVVARVDASESLKP
jgi:Skp family chaperone for outer membrane proteins